MKLLSVFLILAALHTLDGKVTPKVKKDKAVNLDDGATGRYCGSVSLLLASEYVELWVHAHSKTFDFRARGIATVPWCPGNKFSEEIKDNGDRVGVPIMTQAKKCLKHELRHLGKKAQTEPPLEVRWSKSTDSIEVLVKNVPLVKTITLKLTRDACDELVKNVAHEDEL